MTSPVTPVTDTEARPPVIAERHRCVGVVLAEVGRQRRSGRLDVAAVLDDLALRLEHPELEAK